MYSLPLPTLTLQLCSLSKQQCLIQKLFSPCHIILLLRFHGKIIFLCFILQVCVESLPAKKYLFSVGFQDYCLLVNYYWHTAEIGTDIVDCTL